MVVVNDKELPFDVATLLARVPLANRLYNRNVLFGLLIFAATLSKTPRVDANILNDVVAAL